MSHELQTELARTKRELAQARHELDQARHELVTNTEEFNKRVRDTTLPEYMDACHTHFFGNLNLQTNPLWTTQGTPVNAQGKKRPRQLKLWQGFLTSQRAVWTSLANHSNILEQRLFQSYDNMRRTGETDMARRPMSSELDLYQYEGLCISSPVTTVLQKLSEIPRLCSRLDIRGTISFQNQSNMLSPWATSGNEPSGLRRSQRIKSQSQETTIPRPRADQFCVQTIGGPDTGMSEAVFIVEYKAPHKLTLNTIKQGLVDMDLDDITTEKDTDGDNEKCQRLVAAVITQVFSYMVAAGVQYGCVRTGQAAIYLNFDADSPETLYYFLSDPCNDVGDSTGWNDRENSKNRLHLTSIGQMIAFTLQALKQRTLAQVKSRKIQESLPTWQIECEDLSIDQSIDQVPPSEYRPATCTEEFERISPIQLRKRRRDDDEDGDTNTPSRQGPQTHGSSRPTGGGADPNNRTDEKNRTDTSRGNYCSHQCLLNLQRGGPIDPKCPNATTHGTGHVDLATLRNRLCDQLRHDMDIHFQPFAREGRCGVPFRLHDTTSGYTLVAKCVPEPSVPFIEHENTIYARLHRLQGSLVPVCLGVIRLPFEYSYMGAVGLTSALLLSFGGQPLWQTVSTNNWTHMMDKVDRTLAAVHMMGVVHGDVRCPNLLTCNDSDDIMLVDFERAKIRRPLASTSGNQKWKRRGDDGVDKTNTVANKSRCTEGSILRRELEFEFS